MCPVIFLITLYIYIGKIHYMKAINTVSWHSRRVDSNVKSNCTQLEKLGISCKGKHIEMNTKVIKIH